MKWITLFLLPVLVIFSCSEAPTKPESYEEIITIRDYQFLDNQYFFIDTYYKEMFESGYNENLQVFVYQVGNDIIDLDVYISAPASDSRSIIGAAVLDPTDPNWQTYENYSDIPDERGQSYSTTFRLLNDSLYSYDPYRGFFWLSHSVTANYTLAIKYKLANGKQVGLYNDSNFNILLKLIKPRHQVPLSDYDSTWPLVMRNVYFFGDSVSTFDDYNVEIKHGQTDAKEDSAMKSYLNLLGLDILDEFGVANENGDGQIDFNPYIFDQSKGTLIFPGLQPFAPIVNSRFQLRNEDRVEIYEIVNKTEIAMRGKFVISFLAKK